MVGKEVKDPPVLLDVRLGVGFESVDHVGELHPIADEEDWKIVSHQIKITLMTRNEFNKVSEANIKRHQ